LEQLFGDGNALRPSRDLRRIQIPLIVIRTDVWVSKRRPLVCQEDVKLSFQNPYNIQKARNP